MMPLVYMCCGALVMLVINTGFFVALTFKRGRSIDAEELADLRKRYATLAERYEAVVIAQNKATHAASEGIFERDRLRADNDMLRAGLDRLRLESER